MTLAVHGQRYHPMSKTPGLEIERKFLLSGAPDGAQLRAHGARSQAIIQHYLKRAPAGPTRRLRVLGTGSGTRYLYTEKRALSGIVREEHERTVGLREAKSLLSQADPVCAPIEKVRWTWDEDGQTWELDIFTAPAGLVLLEVELFRADERVRVPAWLGFARDVSEDSAYTNSSLARRLGAERSGSGIPGS